MKKIITIFLVVILLICFVGLSGCGYNAVMYKHLSTVENYGTYTLTLKGIYLLDEDKRLTEYDKTVHGVGELHGAVCLGVEDDGRFSGGEYLMKSGDYTEPMVMLEVMPENSRLLEESGFYSVIASGETVEVTVSNQIYMDGNFYYVIGVSCGEVTYPESETGLRKYYQYDG